MDLQLAGKRALISGGSRGIGKAVALALAQEGVQVAILARQDGPLQRAALEIGQASAHPVVTVRADTSRDDEVRHAFAQAVSQLGGNIDILVNAAAEPAGYGSPPGTLEISSSFFHQELNIKVMGYLRCAQQVIGGMKAQGWGRIINISGLAARQTGNAVGSVRNVALSALSKNMADELGPFGIHVLVVHPGQTRTERTAALIENRAAAQGLSVKDVEVQMAQRNSIHHLLDAAEVADVIAFLCSPRARAINGDAIALGGGAPGSIHY